MLDGGKYLLQDELGEGSAGNRVWRGSSALGEAVTVKIIPIPANDETRRKRLGYFKDEVECGERLRNWSKHIRRMLDAGTVEQSTLSYRRGVWYIVFEFVEYGSLRRLLGERLLSWPELRELARAIGEGLTIAHNLTPRICHRDLKPENILLPGGSCDQAKVADFGIARALDGTRLTTTGGFAGTARYAAPEQFSDSHAVDPRADLYSLALVLWEGITGKVPYDRKYPAEIMSARLKGEPLPALTAHSKSLHSLSRVLHAALEREPRNRPASVEEFVRGVDAAGASDGLWRQAIEKLSADMLPEYLKSKGIKYKDNRKMGGALWLIGGTELKPLTSELSRQAIYFTFKKEGTKATGFGPGWWTSFGR